MITIEQSPVARSRGHNAAVTSRPGLEVSSCPGLAAAVVQGHHHLSVLGCCCRFLAALAIALRLAPMNPQQ